MWSFFPFPPQQWFYISRVRKMKILEAWWWGETASQRNSRKEEKYDRRNKLSTTLEKDFPRIFSVYYYTVVHIFHLSNLHSKNSPIMSIHLTSLSWLQSSAEKYLWRGYSFHSIPSVYGSNFAPGSSLNSSVCQRVNSSPVKFFNSKCEKEWFLHLNSSI